MSRPGAGAPVCPVCGTACPGEPSARYSAARAASHFCPRSRDADRFERLTACISRLWDGDESRVFYCPACGFGFGEPFVGGDAEFYQIIHEHHGYPKWRWDYDVALREGLGPADSVGGALNGAGKRRVLDIGAGDGAFLGALGPGWERYATEFTETMREVLRGRGITVLPDLEAAAASYAGTFDAVTLFQVLEHVADFRPLLRTARALLKPGGRITVAVPNGPGVARQEELIGYPDMPPNHINRWSGPSLALALRQAGFEPGPAIVEPASWRWVPHLGYCRVRMDAEIPGTLAARIYRVRRRRVRAMLVRGAVAINVLKLLPHLTRLKLSMTMAMVGRAV